MPKKGDTYPLRQALPLFVPVVGVLALYQRRYGDDQHRGRPARPPTGEGALGDFGEPCGRVHGGPCGTTFEHRRVVETGEAALVGTSSLHRAARPGRLRTQVVPSRLTSAGGGPLRAVALRKPVFFCDERRLRRRATTRLEPARALFQRQSARESDGRLPAGRRGGRRSPRG